MSETTHWRLAVNVPPLPPIAGFAKRASPRTAAQTALTVVEPAITSTKSCARPNDDKRFCLLTLLRSSVGGGIFGELVYVSP